MFGDGEHHLGESPLAVHVRLVTREGAGCCHDAARQLADRLDQIGAPHGEEVVGDELASSKHAEVIEAAAAAGKNIFSEKNWKYLRGRTNRLLFCSFI